MLRFSDLKKIYRKRSEYSYKGQNGKVLILGGSLEFHGAPLLSAKSAIKSGADLIFLFVPECNYQISKSFSPEFIVHSFPDNLTKSSISSILQTIAEVDAILIGPGLSTSKETIEAISTILQTCKIPIVLDAGAIQAIHLLPSGLNLNHITITPHFTEFEQFIGKTLSLEHSEKNILPILRSVAMDYGINLILKGKKDYLVSHNGSTLINETGNPGMTVGGTGDILAGVLTSLLAQKYSFESASSLATYACGKAGDNLLKISGYAYSPLDLIDELPFIFSSYLN